MVRAARDPLEPGGRRREDEGTAAARVDVRDHRPGGLEHAGQVDVGFDENGLDPVYGLASSGQVNPGGLKIAGSVGYEAPGTGYLRNMATGAKTTYTYYGDTETRANPASLAAPWSTRAACPS
ncbi:hypothetical protein [Amycolatopsis deserti]|uniref:hypothetical protein n=1 Tax=Amycolatopsis deserti TaxID=185696 RepID=UPI00174C53EA|nr:hypothetical protein [Amycolatopsis deserti]